MKRFFLFGIASLIWASAVFADDGVPGGFGGKKLSVPPAEDYEYYSDERANVGVLKDGRNEKNLQEFETIIRKLCERINAHVLSMSDFPLDRRNDFGLKCRTMPPLELADFLSGVTYLVMDFVFYRRRVCEKEFNQIPCPTDPSYFGPAVKYPITEHETRDVPAIDPRLNFVRDVGKNYCVLRKPNGDIFKTADGLYISAGAKNLQFDLYDDVRPAAFCFIQSLDEPTAPVRSNPPRHCGYRESANACAGKGIPPDVNRLYETMIAFSGRENFQWNQRLRDSTAVCLKLAALCESWNDASLEKVRPLEQEFDAIRSGKY